MGGLVSGPVQVGGGLAFDGAFGAGAVCEDLAHAVGDEGEEVFAVVDFDAGIEGGKFLAVDFLDEVRGIEATGGWFAGEEGLRDGAEALGGGGEHGIRRLAIPMLHATDQFGEAGGLIHEK